MIRLTLVFVALCAMIVDGIPAFAGSNEDGYANFGGQPVISFFLPEPICWYKCGIKCYRKGLMSGDCQNSICSCYAPMGYSAWYPYF